MRHRQRGVTFLGWLFLLVPIGILLYTVIRLTPVYLEYMNVARALEQVKTEYDGNGPTASAIRVSLEKRFDVDDVNTITAKDIIIRPGESGLAVSASYDATAPLFANLSLLVSFNKTVEISR
jgi:hypothetical protein